MAAICILLFALGHLVRDGWPPLGSTHGARALGAALCGAGAWFALRDVTAAAVGILVLASFYADKCHGEGQNAKTPEDANFLLLSGLTSVSPLVFINPFVVGVAWLKPCIWRGAWRAIPVDTSAPKQPWLTPTRLAAMVFGAMIGAVVAVTP